MKNIYKILTLAIILLMVSACSTNDDGERRLVVTTVTDIQFTVAPLGIEVGDLIGEIPGTSSRGSVTFAIASQPINAFSITENLGELVVADPNLILENENATIALVVSVTKEDVTENTNVTLTILPSCPNVNISTFIGNLSVVNSDVPNDISSGIGSLESVCNSILTLTGGDPLALGDCFDSVLQIIFFEGDGNTGEVILERQNYCTGGVEIDGIGTYNLLNKTITIDVNRTENGVTEPFGTVTISCDSIVNTSLWEGDLIYDEITIDFQETGTGASGCSALTLMGDIGFFECDPGFVPAINYILTPSSPGATSGTIIAESQGYNCFDGSVEILFYEATGTYDEVTGEIELNYEFFEDNVLVLEGTVLVTPL